ncbi:MAG: AmmeMemoRadiSam system protein B [Candidatus Omnitrophica bacterium]|nr:AmmeMemoRadiSam system protein B [Candidatus Omnitrophota bacterium]
MKKILILTVLMSLLSCSSSSSEEPRRPAVSGAFYPADEARLKEMLNGFLADVRKHDIEGRILAIVVPHAGYVYSGQVAAYGFKQLEGRKVSSAILICNSHTARFPGIAIDGYSTWKTPLGLIALDKEIGDKIVRTDSIFQYNSPVHERDHTIEVQLPFLQTVLDGDFKIVPMLFGNSYDDSYKKLAQALADNLSKEDIVIISTDMSHYPSYEDANKIDRETLEFIKGGDVPGLEAHISGVKARNVPGEDTVCCGIDGIKTIMELSNILGGEIEILKYANSGDVEIGDKSRVVGYSSVVIYIPEESDKKGETIMSNEYLNKKEKQKLIDIARASIIEAVAGEKQAGIEVTEERLKENCGAFVTIKKHGQLRGCIGYIIAVKSLYETVKDVAKSAAINDPRFSPVSKEELDEIELEISALTTLKKIIDVDKIEVGKHGIYMKRGFNSGLLLPQVATEYGWDKETFLEHTCMKAGLPATAWKDSSTEIYIFSAEVFSEKEVQ